MSSEFGFFSRGNAGNLILGDDNPVLVQLLSGDLRVTRRFGNAYNAQGAGSCAVTYPEPITTFDPPMVFGVPNPTFAGGGIGRFSHIGRPGYWTGFRVVFTNYLDYRAQQFDPNNALKIGQQTGWSYRVCTFRAPPSQDRFGLRLFDAEGQLVFDSGWPIVPFRGLLKSWAAAGGGYYDPIPYWGDSFYNSTPIDDADRYGTYRHAWGVQDGEMGVLISSLCTMVVLADTGSKNTRIKTIPMIGFTSQERYYLTCTLTYGTIQHAGTAGPALSSFGLLTADFSRA